MCAPIKTTIFLSAVALLVLCWRTDDAKGQSFMQPLPGRAENRDFYGENIFDRDIYGNRMPSFRTTNPIRNNGQFSRGRNAQTHQAAPTNFLLKALDQDGDMEISVEELQHAVDSLSGLDKNDDGMLSMDEIFPSELLNAVANQAAVRKIRQRAQQLAQKPSPKEQFVHQMVAGIMKFDINRDGRVSKKELPRRLDKFMRQVDTNKDGILTQQELYAAAEKRWSST